MRQGQHRKDTLIVLNYCNFFFHLKFFQNVGTHKMFVISKVYQCSSQIHNVLTPNLGAGIPEINL